MQDKGFFDILFVLIIFGFFVNISLFAPNSFNYNSNFSKLDSLALTLDSVVVDALGDQTYDTFCSISPKNSYDSKINNYLDNIKLDLINNSGVDVNFELVNTLLNSQNYSGEIEIDYVLVSNNIDLNLTKTLKFNKRIMPSVISGSICNVGILDAYDLSKVQLDKNTSLP